MPPLTEGITWIISFYLQDRPRNQVLLNNPLATDVETKVKRSKEIAYGLKIGKW